MIVESLLVRFMVIRGSKWTGFITQPLGAARLLLTALVALDAHQRLMMLTECLLLVVTQVPACLSFLSLRLISLDSPLI